MPQEGIHVYSGLVLLIFFCFLEERILNFFSWITLDYLLKNEQTKTFNSEHTKEFSCPNNIWYVNDSSKSYRHL